MKKLKLINLSKSVSLTDGLLEKIKGGSNLCCCGCCGPSGRDANYDANDDHGYSCSCGDTDYGSN